MKNTLIALFAITIVSCVNAPKDYVTLSGKIIDKNSDSVVVRTRTYSKTIKVTRKTNMGTTFMNQFSPQLN